MQHYFSKTVATVLMLLLHLWRGNAKSCSNNVSEYLDLTGSCDDELGPSCGQDQRGRAGVRPNEPNVLAPKDIGIYIPAHRRKRAALRWGPVSTASARNGQH